MSFLKETFKLISLLFSPIRDKEDVIPYPMTHYPFKGYKYMMWCGRIIYRDEKPEYIEMSDVDRNHERIHIRQAVDKGSWIKYYLAYFWNWLIKNPFTAPRKSAYYMNKYEVEAYAKERDMTYLSRRNCNFVSLFNIKSSKKFYKENNSIFVLKSAIRIRFKNI